MRRTTFAVVPPDLTAKPSDPRIQLALKLLRNSSLSSSIRVNEIAAILKISSSHLRHLFKKELGMAPTQYAKVLRLRKAKKLLETTRLSVKEVMAAVGLNDLSHFVRDYKERYGKTPSQTRASAGTQ